MAYLKDEVLLSEQTTYPSEIFYLEEGAELFEVLKIDEESLILVKEWLGASLIYSFFDIKDNKKIHPATRFSSENNKEVRQTLDNGLHVIKTINVNSKTGLESVTEQVMQGNVVLYKCMGERYPERTFNQLYIEYLEYQREQNNHQDRVKDFANKFKKYSKKQQIGSLRAEFRNKWRANCEWGSENPEYFLTQEMYHLLNESPRFKKSLMTMLEMECDFIGEDPVKLFDSIVEHYEQSYVKGENYDDQQTVKNSLTSFLSRINKFFRL